MRVLITGLKGYIGSVMERTLLSQGHEVTGLDTGYFTDCSMSLRTERSTVLTKDVRDLVSRDLAGIDAVVHLAALSNDPTGDLQPDWTYQINLHGSLHLAKVARDAGVKRFLFSSSCSVYGTCNQENATETAPLKPLSAYAVSKARTEEGLDKLADGNFSPVYLRNATAYGVSSRMRLDLVLNNLTAWAFTTGRVQIMSDGTPWRPLVHIDDISRAFAAALVAPRAKIHNQAFNVGANAENYQVKDLAELVREQVPNSNICYAGGKTGPDPRSYRLDFSKIRSELAGFTPISTARKGIAELHGAFREAGLKASDLESRNYIRLKQLRHLLESGALDENLRWKALVAA